MRKFEVALWGFTLGAVVVSIAAMSARKQILPDQAFLVAFDGEDAPPIKFRLWCDGGIVKNYSNAEVRLGKNPTRNADGSYTYTLSAPALSLTGHTCFVSAFNEQSEAKSEPLQIAPECRLYGIVKK